MVLSPPLAEQAEAAHKDTLDSLAEQEEKLAKLAWADTESDGEKVPWPGCAADALEISPDAIRAGLEAVAEATSNRAEPHQPKWQLQSEASGGSLCGGPWQKKIDEQKGKGKGKGKHKYSG